MSDYDENCVFCKIIKGEIPSYKVYEDDDVLAFLDISQTTPGHTLLIPKKHVPNIYQMNEKDAAKLFSKLPKIANAIKASNPKIKGMNILNNNGQVAYQSVFHAHIHLVPRYSENDTFSINFTDNSKKYNEKKYQAIQSQIKHGMEESK